MWSSDAKADFAEGLVWLGERNKSAADKFERDVDIAIQQLAQHPFMGRSSKIGGLRLISLVKWRRRIAYQTRNGVVYIVSLKHTRQNFPP